MKKVFYLLFASLFIFSCSSQAVKLTVQNPSNFERKAELVEVSVSDLKVKLPLKNGEVYVVKNVKGIVIPSQITYYGKLIFQSDLDKKATAEYAITTGEPQTFEAKTYGRLITERKDDFAWENDRVAFRVYGPALMPIDGPSNGIDIWYKRTNKLIIDEWYKKDLSGQGSYHDDHGEGLDDYKVGRSLGAGAMAPFVDGKLWMNENFASQEILENGPLRTTIKLTYKNLDVKGNKFSETRTISIDAGSQYSKVVQAYGVKEPIVVAAGVAERDTTDLAACIANQNFMIYTETSKKAGEIYVGVIIPKGIDEVISNTYTYENPINKSENTYSHSLALTKYTPNAPLVYYTGYGWTKFGFANQDEFIEYTKNFEEALTKPLVVKFK